MATIKQKQVFKEVVNSGSSISKAMVKAGYAISTSKRTEKVTRTKGWHELMEEHLPDSVLAKRHRELLNKKETVNVFDGKGKGSHVELTEQPDTQAVAKALDMAYKLKDKYAPDKQINLNITLLDVLTDLERTEGKTEAVSPEVAE